MTFFDWFAGIGGFRLGLERVAWARNERMNADIDKVLCIDAETGLARLESDSVDMMLTDPPYGYKFMGHDWDRAVPGVEVWKGCLRALKPGAFAFVMSAPRLDVLSQMAVRLQEAGFVTAFTPIFWAYAQGFPKATNIGKAVDKRQGAVRQGAVRQGAATKGNTFPLNSEYIDGPAATPEAAALDGSYAGFQPKPAVEVVIVAMKPLSEKNYVAQAMKDGKGVTWLDDGRIPFEPDDDVVAKNPHTRRASQPYSGGWGNEGDDALYHVPAGRFPANLLVSDDALNDGVERVSTGGCSNNQFREIHNVYGTGIENKQKANPGLGDCGSFSRYFDLDAWFRCRFVITPKASKSEKNAGCEGLEERQTIGGGGTNSEIAKAYGAIKARGHNHHPTVKPLKLFSYLVTIGSRPGDIVLDPFIGSGTTGMAAAYLDRRFIGFEREQEYVEIAERRIAFARSGLTPEELEMGQQTLWE